MREHIDYLVRSWEHINQIRFKTILKVDKTILKVDTDYKIPITFDALAVWFLNHW